MKHSTALAVLLIAVGVTAFPTTAQNNQPDDVREMARKVMMPILRSCDVSLVFMLLWISGNRITKRLKSRKPLWIFLR